MNSQGSAEYREGATAFLLGESEDDCPYPAKNGRTVERIAWFDGYFDKRTGTRLAKAFKFYGVQWP